MAATRAKATYLAKAAARRVLWGPSDLLRRRDGRLLPPRHISFVGAGDFEQNGREFLGYFTELGGLEPTDRVLDVGCGVGRMALPLTGYLDGGSYAGFDVGHEMIRWCERNITPRWPHFEFAWVPVFNAKYNPFGNVSGAEFRFPYEDAGFDFALATSLFTHLQHAETRHYLEETARILRPGGACLLTFFLLTPEAEAGIAAGRATFDFRHPIEGGMAADPRQPEQAIAFHAGEVRALIEGAGLRVRQVHPGSWSDPSSPATLQDIVVAERPGG